jgi:hypothetical protein
MTLALQDLTLAAATLSGGARLVAAGSGLPQRITTADDKFFSASSMGNTTATRNGVAFDPDGLHFWIVAGTTAGASTGFRKIRISDGAVITTITGNTSDGGTRVITSPQSLTRRGNKLYCANSGTGNYLCEYDMVTGICRMYSQATLTGPSYVISDGTNLWARTGALTSQATLQEFTLAGTGNAAAATATARTIATMFDAAVDNAGVYLYASISTGVTRFKISDGTTATFTPATPSINFPGYNSNTIRNLAWDTVEDKLIVRHGGLDTWWYVNATFDGAEKRAFGLFELGGIIAEISTTSMVRSPIAWSDDGKQLAMAAVESGAQISTVLNVRVRNIAVQRARWTWTPGQSVTLKSLRIPGDLGNVRGYMSDQSSVPAFYSAVDDHRKSRVYYQVNAAARVEYKGEDLSVALAAADVLTVDVDMQHLVTHPHFVPPFVGGDTGEGVRVLYDTAITRRRNRLQAGL